jgi:hypothetical protein
MQRKEWYKNGYGASIIDTEHSYGLEIAVLTWEKKKGIVGESISTDEMPEEWEICYTTELADDVIPHCEGREQEILDNIRKLPIRDSHK